jgi:hypothetical protein
MTKVGAHEDRCRIEDWLDRGGRRWLAARESRPLGAKRYALVDLATPGRFLPAEGGAPTGMGGFLSRDGVGAPILVG